MKSKRTYVATFDAQAWIRDYATSVDPEGPTTWDCTDFVRAMGLEGEVIEACLEEGHWLDRDDQLLGDPAIPEWAREWYGPSTVTVEMNEEEEGENS